MPSLEQVFLENLDKPKNPFLTPNLPVVKTEVVENPLKQENLKLLREIEQLKDQIDDLREVVESVMTAKTEKDEQFIQSFTEPENATVEIGMIAFQKIMAEKINRRAEIDRLKALIEVSEKVNFQKQRVNEMKIQQLQTMIEMSKLESSDKEVTRFKKILKAKDRIIKSQCARIKNQNQKIRRFSVPRKPKVEVRTSHMRSLPVESESEDEISEGIDSSENGEKENVEPNVTPKAIRFKRSMDQVFGINKKRRVSGFGIRDLM